MILLILCGLATAGLPVGAQERQLSLHTSRFLGDLPPQGTRYQPKQPITKKLQAIIDEHDYAADFEEAIQMVSAQGIPERYLDANDPTGYQFVQCRGLLVLQSPIGKVAVLPIGMAQVSSVVFVTPKADGQQAIRLSPDERRNLNYDRQVTRINEKISDALVGRRFAKGEAFSFFQFGGSDCVMVFERKANVDFTAQIGVRYQIRSQCAVSNLNR